MTHLQSSPQIPACPVCGCHVLTNEDIHKCPGCDTPHHSECWHYNEGCAIYACDGKPRQELLPEPPKRLGSIALDGRFEFYDERAPANSIERAILSATILVIVAAALIQYGFMAAFFTVALFWYGAKALATTTRINGRKKTIERVNKLGSLVLRRQSVPFSSVSLMNLDDCFSEEGNEHHRLLRASLALNDGANLRLALDFAERGLKDEDVERWAKALQDGTPLMITHVIVPRRRILTKRIRAFQAAIHQSSNSPYYDLGWPWRMRWFAYLPSCTFAAIVNSMGYIGIDVFFAPVLIFFMTLLFLFLRPHDLFGIFYGTPRNAVNPYPEGYLEFDEKGTLKKLAGFLTFVEEKELPSLLSEKELERMKIFANGLVYSTPLVWSLLYGFARGGLIDIVLGKSLILYLGLFHVALVAALGAAMQRAVWDEQWVRDWLHESSKALSYDPGEHGHRYKIRDRNAKEKEPIVIDKRGALPMPDEFKGEWQDPDETKKELE